MGDRIDRPAPVSRGPLVFLRRLIRFVFFVRYRYENELERQRAQALHVMCLIFGGVGLIASTLQVALNLTTVWPTVVVNLGISALFLVLIELVNRGFLRQASYGFVVLTAIVPVVQNLAFDLIPVSGVYMSLAIPIVSAALLISPLWTAIATVLSIAAVAVVGYVDYQESISISDSGILDEAQRSALMTGVLLIILGFFSSLMAQSLFRWAESNLRRYRQMEAAALIGETSGLAPTLNALLNVVVERIRDAFGFYHAQVFMVDAEGRLARLEASTGRAGVALLARGHALRVGSQSMVGQCSFLGEPIIVNDTVLSSVWRPNELLPDTRAELVLPLKVGNTVIGVLDVQSTTPNVFQPEDVRSLQIMAQQLATTVEKTRLLDQVQIRAAENQQLLEEAQTSLQQVEDLNRRLTREGWADFLASRRGGALGFTLAGEAVERDLDWTAPMRQAFVGERSVVVAQDQQAHIAAVPLRIRGEVVGVLEIERGGGHPWTDEELNMAETLVERLALAVENARLYEQATQATEREQVINKIAQDVQAAETIDQILQSALTELGSVLGASRGIVQISPKQDEQPPRAGQTGLLPEVGA